MLPEEILDHLARHEAVLTGSHFAYTAGGHGTGYINMRAVAHHAWFLAQLGEGLAVQVAAADPDLVLGPETLGRTLAGYTANHLSCRIAIWCDIVGEGKDKRAVFNPKLGFERLVPGKRVAIVDDLLTTGLSIRLAANLVTEHGGTPVAAASVVRRSPEVSAKDCGVPRLEVLADIQGFETFSQAECEDCGPCFHRVPMVLRPGHGYEWIKSHPDYPVAA